ncbi:unnamed protein product [Auanema sp. JU1783]|nr:unnamed protein product [Auanema sp. JU1783]
MVEDNLPTYEEVILRIDPDMDRPPPYPGLPKAPVYRDRRQMTISHSRVQRENQLPLLDRLLTCFCCAKDGRSLLAVKRKLVGILIILVVALVIMLLVGSRFVEYFIFCSMQ